MNGRVSVVGAGVGSLTCASLLARRGWDVSVRHVRRRARPVLVLNEVALSLLDAVWGPGVVDGSHPISQRRVRWGEDEAEAAVPVTAAAIQGDVVVERLLDRLPATTDGHRAPDWVVDATGPSDDGQRVVFGRRCVVQAEVTLRAEATSTAWIETVADGWVHVAPVGGDRAVVQCMVPGRPSDPADTLRRMIAGTAGIAGRIGQPAATASVFGAAPTLRLPSCGPGWIAVADGAVSLDPLSGLGTAWALRGGILAAAVIDGTSSGLGEAECLGHYEARLREALHSHVEHCLRLYAVAFSTPEWKDELGLMAQALETERHRHPPEAFGLRLNGLRLERYQSAARAGERR